MKKTYLNRLRSIERVIEGDAPRGEIFLLIDGKPELPPADPRRNRIVLDMHMGWDEVEDAPSLKEEVKTEVNPAPFIPDSPALPPISVQAEQEPEAEEEPGELSRLLGKNRRRSP